jgi:hypothetical protein
VRRVSAVVGAFKEDSFTSRHLNFVFEEQGKVSSLLRRRSQGFEGRHALREYTKGMVVDFSGELSDKNTQFEGKSERRPIERHRDRCDIDGRGSSQEVDLVL